MNLKSIKHGMAAMTAIGALLTVSLIFPTALLAQQNSETRPVFDEKFDHWPTQLKINGRIFVNRGMTKFRSVDRLLKRVSKDKQIVSFASDEDVLGSHLESQLESADFSNAESEVTELSDALTNADMIYIGMDQFSNEQLLKLKDEFHSFVGQGGNLIFDSSCATILGSKSHTSAEQNCLDLFSDCVIDNHFDGSENESTDLATKIKSLESKVGIGIGDDSMLLLSGRTLVSFGSGSSTLVVSASETEPARSQKLGASRSSDQVTRADLTQWRRMAIDRSVGQFPPAKPRTPFVENGSLYIVGGGGMPTGLMREMIEKAGGIKKAKLVYVPCSEADDVKQRQRTVQMWKRIGVKHATFIHTKDRNIANSDEEFLEPLTDATMIWFGGGRQWNFADSYYGTKAHKLMKEVLHRGGVIGGSSAGASIQGRFLARATPIGNSNILAPGYERGGLGFLAGVAIDQHFSQRGRQKDMTQLVEKYPQLLGIGIDEATAIVVEKSNAKVIGRGKVYFYDRTKPAEKDKPDYVALPAGAEYDLENRKVTKQAQSDSE